MAITCYFRLHDYAGTVLQGACTESEGEDTDESLRSFVSGEELACVSLFSLQTQGSTNNGGRQRKIYNLFLSDLFFHGRSRSSSFSEVVATKPSCREIEMELQQR